MSSARTEILSRVRSALSGGDGTRAGLEDLKSELLCRHATVRPQLSPDTVALFRVKAEANLMTLHDIAHIDEVPSVVSMLLASANMPPDISLAPALQSLAWPQTMTRRSGKARIDERLTVSRATAGIAETGSVVLCSGENAPSSLSYAPEIHVAVLMHADIVPYLEDGLARVKALKPWPRAVNLVSGPSRTADVAGIVVRPAHGPKAVHLIIVGATG